MEYEDLTKAELQNLLDSKGIEYQKSDTKKLLIEKLKIPIENSPKFTKKQILNKRDPEYNLDVMFVVLEDGKLYTKDEAMGLYIDFMNRGA